MTVNMRYANVAGAKLPNKPPTVSKAPVTIINIESKAGSRVFMNNAAEIKDTGIRSHPWPKRAM